MARDFFTNDSAGTLPRAEEHPPLGEAERERVLSGRNRTPAEYPRDTCVHELFTRQAALTPEATAVVYERERLTYRELDERADRLADYLRSVGVGADVVVGLLMERSVEMIVGLLGILKAGGAYMPLDAQYPRARLEFMLGDARANVLLTQERLRDMVPAAATHVLSLDAEWPEVERRVDAEPAAAGPENLAYVLYTSGSTGQPKGVCVTHRNVVRLVRGNNYAELTPDEVILQLAPVSFDASTFEIWGALLNGARLVLMPQQAPSLEELAGALSKYQITTLWLTAGLFHQMVDHELEALGGLRQLLAGGDVLSVQHVKRVLRELPNVRLINGYGPTENTTFTCCYSMSQESDVGASVPIGRPIANTSAYVLDAEMRPVASGAAGELYTGGDGLARGYENRPELTAERFVPDPYGGEPGARLYRTGDLVRYLPDGQIEFLGRLDYQVKIRGFRIELSEVETVIGEHADVQNVVVLAREDEPGEKRLVAYVVGREGAQLTAADLRSFLRERVPEHLIPSAFVRLEGLPLTANGKVDRRALPAPGPSRPELEAEYVAARTPVEASLAEIWGEVLGIEQVGVNDNFFELGGHSLKATQIVSRIRNTFQTDLPLLCIFEAPTVAGVAQYIEGDGRGARELQLPPLRPVERQGDIPLSFSQERIWFLQRLAPESKAYNFQATLNFKGALDASVLERSLNEIVRRHEILRTTFPQVGERPVQLLHPHEPFRLPVVDLEEHPESERAAELERHIREEILQPFDLARLPLMRWTLYRLSATEHVLLHVEHHLLHDGWSFNVFLTELFELYRAFSAGEPSPLPELPLQFADFAVWQRRWMEDGAADAQLDYWKRRLAGSPGVLELPLDRPRPPMQSFRGAVLRVNLPSELSARVRQFSRREGASLFMTMLTSFLTLLNRYTGQEDLCVGCGIANRRWRETEGLIGMVINNIVSRTDLSGDPTLRELLGRVREVTLDSYANQDVPFEKVVEAVQPERGLSYNPLFQVSFSFHDSPLPETGLPGLEVTLTEGISNGSAKFDLNVIVIPRSERRIPTRRETDDDGLTLMWEYNTDLFDEATATRMIEHYERTLASMVSSPLQHLADVDLLTESEREQVLEGWNRTRSEYPRDTCVHDLVARQAALKPEATAVVSDGERLSYGELNERAKRLADYLRSVGVGRGDRVGLLMGRSVELVVAALGVFKAGAAYVPLDPDHPEERLQWMARDAGVAAVLTSDAGESRRAGINWDSARVVSVKEAQQGPTGDGVVDDGAASVEVSADDLAYVIYTSGSTGRPKGIEVSHGGLTNLVWWHLRAYSITPSDRATLLAAVSFDASVWELWPYLAAGASLHVVPDDARSDPSRLLGWLAESRITVCFLPTPLAEAVVGEAAPDGLALRYVLTGGDALRTRPPERTPYELVNHYGPTEATVVATSGRVSAAGEGGGRVPPIGRPIANTRAYVLDDTMRPLPVGVAGELYLGGDGLARGYLARPELTAERFVPDPYGDEPGARLYRTGDLARYLADGELEYLGRTDHQVKVRGFRIELGEIEAALSAHAGVRECAVAAQTQAGGGGPRLVAYYVAQGTELQTGELREHLRGLLPDYMVPSSFVALDHLPLTQSGKVDRKRLPEVAGESPQTAREYVEPSGEVEEAVASIWSGVLGVERVGVNDNFFELGGHSLLATRVVSRVRQIFKVELPLRSLFEAPTVGEFAELVEARLIEYLENLTDEEAQELLD